MSFFPLLFFIFLISSFSSVLAYRRACCLSYEKERLRSSVSYYVWWVFLCTFIPSFLLLIFWPMIVEGFIFLYIQFYSIKIFGIMWPVAQEVMKILPHSTHLEKDILKIFSATDGLSLTQNFNVLSTLIADIKIIIFQSQIWKKNFFLIRDFFIPIFSMGSAFYSLRQIKINFCAREKVEKFILYSLILCVLFTIFVTFGIIFSMLFETFAFFAEVSPWAFFFGTVWDPGFISDPASGSVPQFGFIPLLAGTVYISLIALIVAVPIGIMSAVYMSEYASLKIRSILKPLIELLAGIPTIVYGIFALIILGPFLRDISAFFSAGSPFIQSQSILTAGFVMGIMLIPIVCSLSDDILTMVPSMMRDASLALGATHSETICKVVLPAALPGIGGAVLLAASRAIGETMIVVLAAGVSAHLTLNPFEAMTTITVKIVNQLTGDTEFNSPQTLVAFALGMTLFVLTFLMNAVSLMMIRKYRRQYE